MEINSTESLKPLVTAFTLNNSGVKVSCSIKWKYKSRVQVDKSFWVQGLSKISLLYSSPLHSELPDPYEIKWPVSRSRSLVTLSDTTNTHIKKNLQSKRWNSSCVVWITAAGCCNKWKDGPAVGLSVSVWISSGGSALFPQSETNRLKSTSKLP